ncbi:MAG: SCP2 sterol-binding domain-containing protein [Chloroflexi bacterium]|nr:SCP2 sterol-binding domain-containing protein [Chloroflexota bacterium]
MSLDKSSVPRNPTARQMVEGMPLAFNREAAADLKAVIQFYFSGREPGIYHLVINSGDCTFHRGTALEPTLRINAPSEVWMQIANGELSGQDALLKGQYKVEGDTSLLLKMGELFKERHDFAIYDMSLPAKGPLFQVFRRSTISDGLTQAGKRPAGPLPLSGMAWMTLLFVPWTIFWILFDIKSVSPWLAAGIPLILMTLIVLYRIIYNRPVWPEIVSWAFFLAACLLGPVLGLTPFLAWGSVIGSLFMGLLWFVSLTPMVKLPFCAEYSKWGFIRKLWGNSMFIQPNMAISLVWGGEFIIASGFGVAARLLPEFFILFTVIRYGLMIPAAVFTSQYQKGVIDRKFADIDRTMSNLRAWGHVGMAIIIIMLVILFSWKIA